MTNPTHIPSFHYILHPCLTPPCRADIHQDGRPYGRPYSTPDPSSGISLISVPDHQLRLVASRASVPGDTGPADSEARDDAADAYGNILSVKVSTGCLAEQPTSGSFSFDLVVL
jgi:hypothetical protein